MKIYVDSADLAEIQNGPDPALVMASMPSPVTCRRNWNTFDVQYRICRFHGRR